MDENLQGQLICGIGEDIPPRPAQATLLDLPNEIISLMLGELDEDEDLYRIGLLSRRLNGISLPLYLSRRGFGSRPPDQLVFYDYNTSDVLKALNAALFKSPLFRLQCSIIYNQSHEKLATEFQRLSGTIKKLSSLREAIFVFHGIPTESSPDIIPLLDSILSLGCETLELSHNDIQSSDISSIPSSNLFLNQPLDLIEKWKNQVLSSIPAIFYPSKTDILKNKLRSVSLRSPIFSYPLLFSWTTHLFDISNIVVLTISQQQSGSWQSILPYLTIPTLTKLSFDSCSIRLHDLMKFFKRHRSIRKLAFGLTFGLTSADEPCRLRGLEMNLTYLSAPPHLLVKFLELIPQVMFTPSLQTLNIHLRIRHGKSFNPSLLDKPLEPFFGILSTIKEVHLLLLFKGIPIDWIAQDIDMPVDEGDIDHNQVHSLTTQLQINVTVYNLTFSSALKIRALLVEFPVLTHLTMRTMSLDDCFFEHQYEAFKFADLMKKSCPSLKIISLP